MEVKERRRGRKPSYMNKARTRNITLYQYHFDVIDNEGIELSTFNRWLIANHLNDYLTANQPKGEKTDNGSQITSISVYDENIEDLVDVNNFSNFLRWGLESKEFIKEYKNQ